MNVRFVPWGLMALALCGCAVSSARTHFYALSAEGAPPAAAARAASGLRVSVWQVAIPEMVDRNQMVVRLDAHRVEIADFHRWAEPLRRGIPRVLAENLAQQLGDGAVVVAGQPAGFTPEVRITLDMQKFDAVLGEGVMVEALWSVRPIRGEARTGRSAFEEKVVAGDYAAIAAAYSRALGRVARDIGETLSASPPRP
jgi:uncharacterized lipoprotein YmbA